MEPLIASICLFAITGGMAGVAFYEHDKILRYIKAAEKKQLQIEKIKKDLTRGKTTIDKKAINAFITKLKVSADIKKELKNITPHSYTGI